MSIIKTNTTPIHRNIGECSGVNRQDQHHSNSSEYRIPSVANWSTIPLFDNWSNLSPSESPNSRRFHFWGAAQSQPPLVRLALLLLDMVLGTTYVLQLPLSLCSPLHFRHPPRWTSTRLVLLSSERDWRPERARAKRRPPVPLDWRAGTGSVYIGASLYVYVKPVAVAAAAVVVSHSVCFSPAVLSLTLHPTTLCLHRAPNACV